MMSSHLNLDESESVEVEVVEDYSRTRDVQLDLVKKKLIEESKPLPDPVIRQIPRKIRRLIISHNADKQEAGIRMARDAGFTQEETLYWYRQDKFN